MAKIKPLRVKEDKALVKLQGDIDAFAKQLVKAESEREILNHSAQKAASSFHTAQAQQELGETDSKVVAAAKAAMVKAEAAVVDCQETCTARRDALATLRTREEAKREAIQQKVDAYYRKQLNDGVRDAGKAWAAFVQINRELSETEMQARSYSSLNLGKGPFALEISDMSEWVYAGDDGVFVEPIEEIEHTP